MSDETSEIERMRAMVARYDACGCGNAYAHAGTIEDYRVMVAAIDAARERIAELEGDLDFAEKLNTQLADGRACKPATNEGAKT